LSYGLSYERALRRTWVCVLSESIIRDRQNNTGWSIAESFLYGDSQSYSRSRRVFTRRILAVLHLVSSVAILKLAVRISFAAPQLHARGNPLGASPSHSRSGARANLRAGFVKDSPRRSAIALPTMSCTD
jgi:hypothetical protein